jgi:hypothetical protein
MNGAEVSEATDLTGSGLLSALEAPFFSDEERIEVLFLATLSRFPSPSELGEAEAYLSRSEELYGAQAQELCRPEKGETDSAPLPARLTANMAATRLTLADVLWALLNSSEFALNH